ncbi:MAG: LmbE family protein [Phycisphaerae bacterium]|mgnify:FL=1|nr:LmbE family protein [Phycisphaerae bacterium]
MAKRVFAVAAHPDDIEFMMGGTFILLGQAGYELHYMTVANGSCGTAVLSRDQIVATRTEESRQAANSVGAHYHPPLVDDLDIYYDRDLVSKLCAIVRKIDPQIILLQSPQDYMEDHMNSSRLMVTAAFCRNIKNFPTDPPTPPVTGEVALYHALPYGLCDQLRNPIKAEMYVDVQSVLDKKRDMLACHRSQKEWLDHSQRLDSYLTTMTEMTARMGAQSGRFKYAEGWRRHSHLGFADEDFDPLRETLAGKVLYTTSTRSKGGNSWQGQ